MSDESIDQRVAVVAGLLKDKFYQQHPELAARRIVEALDQRALSAKWEGARSGVLSEVEGTWIPHSDLLDYLNSLPGAPLTIGDMKARMGKCPNPFYDGEPSEQADCLQVYLREKRAGTEFMAIPGIIYHEVVMPAEKQKQQDRDRKRGEGKLELVRSGRDFRFITGVDPERSGDRYSRHNGQLYRLIYQGKGHFALFHVHDIGDNGKPADPHIFTTPGQASEHLHGRIRGFEPAGQKEGASVGTSRDS